MKTPKLGRRMRRKSASDAYNLATASTFKKPIQASGSAASEANSRIKSELAAPTEKSLDYPSWPTRTPSIHPKRQAPEYQVKEIMRLNPLEFFFAGFIPPFIGAIASIVVALLFHYDEISNYNWQCGRARFPSLSRIINLPMERTFWQFTFLFHIPLRMVEISVGFFRYGRLRNVECSWPIIYTLSRYLYAFFGGFELIFLVALSVVGEREIISYHVIFFYLFGTFAYGFFITNVICHSQSLYYLNPYGRISYYIKIVVIILYVYDVFAITEYCDVFLSIAYHSCAYFDIRHKVIFSIRKVKKVKND
uniref:CWH43-like N-terminal domain-containing protein n=1 Tax=Acrobeloides nanus TaxID=290746 RepID=A0A914C3L0_9BILA